ncbi:MAG: Na/Pi cotransporter family protein [Bacteriovoracia bacterium]
MSDTLDFWKFFAGLGLFLYGMSRLEESVRDLAGKRFKLFLKKYTTNRLLAILNGAITTAILQSSSIVLLMVIAFAGAGIISLSNSLGIILGANLGTTLKGWIVSMIGFGTNMESMIFPMLALGSLGLIFTSRRFYFHHWFGVMVAMALLLLGLDYMKESMNALSQVIDVKDLNQFGGWAFFLFGFGVTAVIQSSSAMMTITLSALFAKVITLVPAAYIAVGADLGTTITALLASFNGTPVKKRVGIAHFFFNIGTAVLALLLLKPLLALLQRIFPLSDPLYLLVAFHSSFNALGIILFFPFLNVFEKFLNKFFKKGQHACFFIHKVNTEVPEAALAVITQELKLFLHNVFIFNTNIIGINLKRPDQMTSLGFTFFRDLLTERDYEADYERIKAIEGELLHYLATLQSEKLDPDESEELNRYILCLRNGVQSAKSAKDILHNFKEFRQSINEVVEEMTNKVLSTYRPVQEKISEIWEENHELTHEKIKEMVSENARAYKAVNEWVYQAIRIASDGDTQVATFLNVNKEIYTANSLLLESLSDLNWKKSQ